jgi:hypothetical protein
MNRTKGRVLLSNAVHAPGEPVEERDEPVFFNV